MTCIREPGAVKGGHLSADLRIGKGPSRRGLMRGEEGAPKQKAAGGSFPSPYRTSCPAVKARTRKITKITRKI